MSLFSVKVIQKKPWIFISKNSQEKACARVSFLIKLQASNNSYPLIRTLTGGKNVRGL